MRRAITLLFLLCCDVEPVHPIDGITPPDACPTVQTATTIGEADGVLLLHAELWPDTGAQYARFVIDDENTGFLRPGEAAAGLHFVGLRQEPRGGGSYLVADYCRESAR